jgi:predicted RNA-binding protein
MEAIFINPRVHTGKGYYERENVPAVATRRAEEVDREEANWIADCLRLELQDVEGHIAEMTACRDEFKRRLNAIEQAERKRQEAEAEKKRQAERVEAEKKRQAAEKKRQEEQKALRRERGLYAHAYTFHNEDVNENFDESVSCIAMGDRATLMVYDHGGYSYTEGMPTGLYNKCTIAVQISQSLRTSRWARWIAGTFGTTAAFHSGTMYLIL